MYMVEARSGVNCLLRDPTIVMTTAATWGHSGAAGTSVPDLEVLVGLGEQFQGQFQRRDRVLVNSDWYHYGIGSAPGKVRAAGIERAGVHQDAVDLALPCGLFRSAAQVSASRLAPCRP